MIVLLTANLYFASFDDPDSEIRALRMEFIMLSFHAEVCAWSYDVTVAKAESQASLQICLSLVVEIGCFNMVRNSCLSPIEGRLTEFVDMVVCRGGDVFICTGV